MSLPALQSSAPVLAPGALRLPAFFPRSGGKDCEGPSSKFFSCFTGKAIKLDGEDSNAGSRGLEDCKKELAAYEACMVKFEQKQQPKRYRVQDEYRARQ